MDNPDQNACNSANACNEKLKNEAGQKIKSDTYMDDHREFTFSIGSGQSCVALVNAKKLLTTGCGAHNYAFCEVSCTAGTVNTVLFTCYQGSDQVLEVEA